MTSTNLLLIFLGPWLMVALAGIAPVVSWPELLEKVFPPPRPRRRPVARPRPARWAVV